MCRVLADLLNPDGGHGCGILFLKSFLELALDGCPMSDLLLACSQVSTEYPIAHGRRIDIVIQNSWYLIPIEVKIEAGEEPGQCYDYCQYAQNAPLVYLTPQGEAPSVKSRGSPDGAEVLPLDRIRRLSWSRDIFGWLASLLPELDGAVKSLAEQYMDTIYKFSGERLAMTQEKQDVTCAALESEELFRAGLQVERSMKAAKVALIRLVFDCFKEEMEPTALKYGLELETAANYYSYKDPWHDNFYDCDTYPGLNYVLRGTRFQKDSLQLWFRIEVEDNLFAGLALFDRDPQFQEGYPRGFQVDDISPDVLEETMKYFHRDIYMPGHDWWLTWCYSNGSRRTGDYPDVPNFKKMNPCAVELADKKKRLQFVRGAIAVFERELLFHLRTS